MQMGEAGRQPGPARALLAVLEVPALPVCCVPLSTLLTLSAQVICPTQRARVIPFSGLAVAG